MIKEIILCVIIGYLLGCPNPAWVLSKLKRKDLRHEGTYNLGATNAYMILGKCTGLFVMLFDIGKSYAAIKIAGVIFPQFPYAGVIAGSVAIMGHMFPFYLRLQGGKGLACLGGVILGLSWELFIPLLLFGLLLAVLTNHACAIAFSAASLFPIVYVVISNSGVGFLIIAVSCICIIIKHFDNIRRIRNGTEVLFRKFLIGHLFKWKKNHIEERSCTD